MQVSARQTNWRTDKRTEDTRERPVMTVLQFTALVVIFVISFNVIGALVSPALEAGATPPLTVPAAVHSSARDHWMLGLGGH